MRLITSDDIIETYIKIYQKGFRYIFSKITFSQKQRTKSTFNTQGFESSNYWSIPRVRQRWNIIITGDKQITYEKYIVEKYFSERNDLSLLSLGSGICSHEMLFAEQKSFQYVKCIDFSEKTLRKAQKNASEQGLSSMVFEVADVNTILIPKNTYDIILFHSSLHHFKYLSVLLAKVSQGLKKGGILVINEYVGPNRLQIKRVQIDLINNIITNEIPKVYRKRLNVNSYKKKVSGSGLLRMLITDPSEAVESKKILPTLRELFDVVEEKNLGGDLLMWLFKDIAHNFQADNAETNRILDRVFQLEDEYIEVNGSAFLFGVYKVKPDSFEANSN
jgi:ubiquinone/menaquinone biosynthesis C-methylase UbiE